MGYGSKIEILYQISTLFFSRFFYLFDSVAHTPTVHSEWTSLWRSFLSPSPPLSSGLTASGYHGGDWKCLIKFSGSHNLNFTRDLTRVWFLKLCHLSYRATSPISSKKKLLEEIIEWTVSNSQLGPSVVLVIKSWQHVKEQVHVVKNRASMEGGGYPWF